MKTGQQKVLLLGSGALRIGQAGEFDYSGSQAIKALKEAGMATVLINPNIATVQTSSDMADEVYFLPITPDFVTEVIKREKPTGILLSFGGQTALNCGVALERQGVLKEYGVKVLGTPVQSIRLTEDRQLFANHLRKLDIPVPESQAVSTVAQALEVAETIGYPVMVRAAYALGGEKSGLAGNKKKLIARVEEALAFSPQVLIEQYLENYKEIEYEVVRDAADNCVCVCNMENVDPLGIHTGESIVVAPSQTLTNEEYHRLRQVSIEIVRSLKIVGECNVQYAVDQHPADGKLKYYVIEVNARLSRSSALASKATGYPLAYVATKLAMGARLFEIENQITQATQAFFEPAMDYIVVKLPRWDLDKFSQVRKELGSSMKSVGEVMAVGRSFEEAIQKAVRMLSIGRDGVTGGNRTPDGRKLKDQLKQPDHRRLFAIASALQKGMRVEVIARLTGIDAWFINRIATIVSAEAQTDQALTKQRMLALKRLGLADCRIGTLWGISEAEVRRARLKWGIRPRVFQIDTLAGEFPAKTNYLYTTYFGEHDDVKPLSRSGVMVLGSGPYRIGSSVEFDWSCVYAGQGIQKNGKTAVMINCNPETVSTDYDTSGRLYFEELTLERVLDIYAFEKSAGVVVSVGGQIPNTLVKKLHELGVTVLGTRPEMIDMAEDRAKFSRLLDTHQICQPAWREVVNLKQALVFGQRHGYPVLVRPSYVLSGDAMRVCYSGEELETYLAEAMAVSEGKPVVLTRYIAGAEEIEYDGVAQQGDIMAWAICEHLEHAGVHSGDATIIYPPQKIYVRTERRIREIAQLLAKALQITGPFNLQCMAKDNVVYVIELNLRASRTFPFVSKATGVNFAGMVADAFFGKAKPVAFSYPDYVVVKSPQFSFSRLEGADPALRVEMASTGEAAGFGADMHEAFLKAELAVGAKIPHTGIFISLGGEVHKMRFLEQLWVLRTAPWPIYATEKTAAFMRRNGVKARRLYKVHEHKNPNVLACFAKGQVDVAINIVDPEVRKEVNDDFVIRRAATDQNIHLITNQQKARMYLQAISRLKEADLAVLPWSAYVPKQLSEEYL